MTRDGAHVRDIDALLLFSTTAMATKYNDNPSQGSRPFDKDRCGFVMGEGAGMVLLESLEHAQKRGAHIYAEVAGFGQACDAHHITTPHPEGAGLAQAITLALEDAGMAKEDLTYINAHGTSTAYNDKFETLAVKKALGEEVAKKMYLSSTKGSTGHTLGAAGGLEAIATVLAIETKTLPPTINYETPDPVGGIREKGDMREGGKFFTEILMAWTTCAGDPCPLCVSSRMLCFLCPLSLAVSHVCTGLRPKRGAKQAHHPG